MVLPDQCRKHHPGRIFSLRGESLADGVCHHARRIVHIRSKINAVQPWHDDEPVGLSIPVGELSRLNCYGDGLGFSRAEVDLAESSKFLRGNRNTLLGGLTDVDLRNSCAGAFTGIGDGERYLDGSVLSTGGLV